MIDEKELFKRSVKNIDEAIILLAHAARDLCLLCNFKESQRLLEYCEQLSIFARVLKI